MVEAFGPNHFLSGNGGVLDLRKTITCGILIEMFYRYWMVTAPRLQRGGELRNEGHHYATQEYRKEMDT